MNQPEASTRGPQNRQALDLGSQDQSSPQFRALHSVHEAFARSLETGFAAFLQTEIPVSLRETSGDHGGRLPGHAPKSRLPDRVEDPSAHRIHGAALRFRHRNHSVGASAWAAGANPWRSRASSPKSSGACSKRSFAFWCARWERPGESFSPSNSKWNRWAAIRRACRVRTRCSPWCASLSISSCADTWEVLRFACRMHSLSPCRLPSKRPERLAPKLRRRMCAAI